MLCIFSGVTAVAVTLFLTEDTRWVSSQATLRSLIKLPSETFYCIFGAREKVPCSENVMRDYREKFKKISFQKNCPQQYTIYSYLLHLISYLCQNSANPPLTT